MRRRNTTMSTIMSMMKKMSMSITTMNMKVKMSITTMALDVIATTASTTMITARRRSMA